jgi:hypothetical protein
MFDDAELLAAVPDFISVSGLLKSTPVEEKGERFLFLEASNEDVDHQNEIVLQKALSESTPYFKQYGNIDISHYTIIGPRLGIANHLEYEIGRPRDVCVDGKKTFVKAELYRGESAQAKNAGMVWDSLTKQKPPCPWYPSVGGAVLAKSIKVDPKTNARVAVVEKVRWSNIALDRTPVNQTVREVSTIPLGVFAKSLNGFVMSKGLTSGYGTDSTSLEGGAALREESLYGKPANYFDFRNKLSKSIRAGHLGKNPGARETVQFSMKTFKLEGSRAAEWVERFYNDLNIGLKRSAS